jgi:hypothetical protein
MSWAMIYKIYSEKGDKVYIGSTIKKYLCNRWGDHRSDYRVHQIKQNKRLTKSSVLFDEYGVDECKIILLEKFEYKTKDEIHQKERHWIEQNPTCVNTLRPYVTKEEEKQRNHDGEVRRRTETPEDYYQKKRRHLNTWKEKNKEPVLCECGETYSMTHKARHFKTERHLLLLELKQLKAAS